MNLFDYEEMVTGRAASLFEEDIANNYKAINDNLKNARVAIIGAAGSIGSAVVKTILEFNPKGLALIDLSENNLVEVVRDIRSCAGLRVPEDFSTLPIGFGSQEFMRYFEESLSFDYVLNFCAIKHVRSEKDIYCLIRMLDTNVLFLHDFLENLPYKIRNFFSVSSDKAANPANLMGASKMVMEEVLRYHSTLHRYSTARFANVAFSDGSLPFGFINRLKKQQAISAPYDVKRYFISHKEASQLCLLSCILGDNGDIFFPKLEQGLNEETFADIARNFLKQNGFDPFECESEGEAKRKAPELIKNKQWPCYFFKTDTSGEKDFEEFYTTSDIINFDRFQNVGIIKSLQAEMDKDCLLNFISFAKSLKTKKNINKDHIVDEFCKVVLSLQHIETGKNLDQKM
ncbi:MAG: polysaccharide biosynthesis protein [Candidatus Scalindua sp.]|nr:polysaccharide biosynthesis protein [Candidatus Scalindua sp.]MDR4503323.1 polysaccharide biosynthesis protein [Candidatus Scalindua sp.]